MVMLRRHRQEAEMLHVLEADTRVGKVSNKRMHREIVPGLCDISGRKS